MKSCTLIPVFLICSFCWISVLVFGSQTVNVLPGENVTLVCTNISSGTITYWFRLVEKNKANCVSIMVGHQRTVQNCDGFQKEKFEMSIYRSTVSLKIKEVDIFDAGLYFCGFSQKGLQVFTLIHLHVNDTKAFYEETEKQKKPDVTLFLTSVTLYGLHTPLIVVIIVLFIKIWKLHKGNAQDTAPSQNENIGSQELTYASVNFNRGGRRTEPEPNVVYAVSRWGER